MTLKAAHGHRKCRCSIGRHFLAVSNKVVTTFLPCTVSYVTDCLRTVFRPPSASNNDC